MRNDEVGGEEQKPSVPQLEINRGSQISRQNHLSEHDSSHPSGSEKIETCEASQETHLEGDTNSTISIRVSHPSDFQKTIVGAQMSIASEPDIELGMSASTKFFLPKCDSYREQCRICQQQTEEQLINLGCGCKGELAKAHSTCMQLWFYTKGSNKCEICQQVATNVPFCASPQTISNRIGRADSGYASDQGHERGTFFSPLLVAFVILLGGLLLDVLISVSLSVTALPLNIIIGVLIVLGLGIGFRLAQECCQSWRRSERADVNINPGLQNTV